MGSGDGTTCGDPGFEQLYKRFHGRLRRYALRTLGDAAAADDVAQESLVRAWQCHDRFASDAEIVPWLWRVARNLCIDVVRARRRVVSIDAVGDHADPFDDVVFPMELREEHRHVRDAFGLLNERHREILYLREVEGAAYPDLAAKLGVSEQGARQVVARARRGLRHALESVTGGTLAVLWWIRTRLTSRADSAHPIAALAMNTLLVAALSAGAAYARAPIDPRVVAGAMAERVGSARVESPPATLTTGAHDRPSAPDDATRPVRVSIDRRAGSAEVSATLRMRGGRTQQVWARLWRQKDDDPSRVLTRADAIGERACSRQPDACARADKILADPLGGR